MALITIRVNGESHQFEEDQEVPLLYVLRNRLRLTGPKFGCGLGQCGSCKVLVGDVAQFSCLVPVGSVVNQEITTIEGLQSDTGEWHPVQQAFMEEQAAQCGYCTGGMIISAVALLRKNNQPEDAEIREALNGNLCRCGSQARVIKAIDRAAKADK